MTFCVLEGRQDEEIGATVLKLKIHGPCKTGNCEGTRRILVQGERAEKENRVFEV